MNNPSTPTAESPETHVRSPRTRSPRFLRVSVTVLALLAVIAAWKVRRDQEFWQSVWDSRSLLAEIGAQRPPAVRPSAPDFDLQGALVPANEIRRGGPPKDGIPALSSPDFVSANNAAYLKPEDRVIGVGFAQQARAFPLKILNYHEIVNDRLGETPIAVTYCPLCDSAAVFDRRTPLGEREFGVSGLLYNSNVLMYDRGGKPETLWSQLMAAGISGAGKNKRLKALPLELTTWADWQSRHPDTLVLSDQTGHSRGYHASPYQSYFKTPQLMFTVNRTDDRLPTKAPVLGIWTDGASKAYPLSAFSGEVTEVTQIKDKVGGDPVTLEYRPKPNSLRVVSAGEDAQWMYSFWFAWAAFRPETEIYHSTNGFIQPKAP